MSFNPNLQIVKASLVGDTLNRIRLNALDKDSPNIEAVLTVAKPLFARKDTCPALL